jgi:hypothetical protein
MLQGVEKKYMTRDAAKRLRLARRAASAVLAGGGSSAEAAAAAQTFGKLPWRSTMPSDASEPQS